MWGIDTFCTCGMDKTFMFILGIDKFSMFDIYRVYLSILRIDNTSMYDIEKPNFLLNVGSLYYAV